MTSQIPSEQNLAVPEETQRRSQVVLQALPVMLIPAISAIATALLVSLVLRTTLTPRPRRRLRIPVSSASS